MSLVVGADIDRSGDGIACPRALSGAFLGVSRRAAGTSLPVLSAGQGTNRWVRLFRSGVAGPFALAAS